MDDPVVVEQGIKLLREGFNEEQIVALLCLRRRIEQGQGEDIPMEYKRLKFARWLVEHDGLHI